MAEPESILQLGIEAARENKKEEARQLFRLLTRQEPDNVQGWLWLAGVAENREERQAALERVLELEPDNEMAVKGLQALGVKPAVAPPSPVPPAAAAAAAAAVAATPPPSRAPLDDDPFGDDDPFAELDNLSDVMASDTAGPVRRTESIPADVDLAAATAAGAAAGAAAASASPRQTVTSSTSSASRGSRSASRYVEDDELEPPRRGLNPLLAVLLFLVGIGLIGLLIFSLFGRDQTAGVDPNATAAVGETAPAGGAPTTDPLGGGTTVDPNATADPNAPVATADPNAPVATPDPNAPVATADPNAPVATPDPNAGGTTPPPVSNEQLAAANPAIIPANTPIESQGWVYDFPQPTYASSIIGNLGQYTPNNGRFVVVLIHAINNTGTPQAIPGSFFVIKDAQGRIWEARPEVSDAYVVPGVNADQTQNTPLPPDGNYRSVAIVFDVAPDATDLVFFARGNLSQGWIILRSV